MDTSFLTRFADCCFRWKQNAKSAAKKQTVCWYMKVMSYTIWKLQTSATCRENIRFMFHFLVRETHKVVCANRDGVKKPHILRGEKNEEIISRNCLPHHKRASSFTNTHEAARLHFIPMFLRYSQMSGSVHHDEHRSSLYDRLCFRYDEQRSSLHAEGLIAPVDPGTFSLMFMGLCIIILF
jgi:hypothetical protein